MGRRKPRRGEHPPRGRRRWLLGGLSLLAIGALGLGACADPARFSPSRLMGWGLTDWGPSVLSDASVTIRTLEKGANSGLNVTTERVIRDEATWKAFYADHQANGKTVPTVDFSREMVVAVVLMRATGGYTLNIDHVSLGSDRMTIHYTETRPGRDAIVIQVLTQPYVFIALPRYEGSVVFERLERTTPVPL